MSKQIVKKKVDVSVSNTLKRIILCEQECKCDNCRGKLNSSSIQTDHIVPRFRHGNNSRNNLHSLCANCHTVKTTLDNAISDGDIETIKHIKQQNPNMRHIADINIVIAIISFNGDPSMKSLVDYDKLIEKNMTDFSSYYDPPTPITPINNYNIGDPIKSQLLITRPLDTPVYITTKHLIDSESVCDCPRSYIWTTNEITKTGVLPHESEMNFENFVQLHGTEMFKLIRAVMLKNHNDFKNYIKCDPDDLDVDTATCKRYKQYRAEPYKDYKKHILSEGPVEIQLQSHIDGFVTLVIGMIYSDYRIPQRVNIQYDNDKRRYAMYNGRKYRYDFMEKEVREKRIILLLFQNIYRIKELKTFDWLKKFIDLVLCPYMIKGYVTDRYNKIVRDALSNNTEYITKWNLSHYPCNKNKIEQEVGITEYMAVILINKFQCDSFKYLDTKMRDMFATIVKETLQPSIQQNLDNDDICESVREILLDEQF